MINEIAPWLGLLPAVALAGYGIARWLTSLRVAQCARREDVIYQEWFASGSSAWNLLTKLGGAHNCLRLVVTEHFLWITSWFPFVLLAYLYDLEHVVPLERILSVRRSRFLWMETLILTYGDERGISRSLRLAPKHQDRFIDALRLPPEKLSPTAVDV
jgi:hypothetical protein